LLWAGVPTWIDEKEGLVWVILRRDVKLIRGISLVPRSTRGFENKESN
jgi:hypothetical protein